jgi:uncharacterized protein (UPF0332 family)
MILTDEERKSVARYRVEKANKTLAEAMSNVDNCCWHAAANRLYYACYYAANALLVNSGHVAKTHQGVFSRLGEHFVSSGLISKEQNKLYRRIFELRQTGDYDDFIEYSDSDILPLLEPAEQFIATIENLINA